MNTPKPPSEPDPAGASALREYNRRRSNREATARSRLGGLGVLLARVTGDPQTTSAWKQGAKAEIQTGAQLQKHLRRTSVVLLHDRRIPGRGRANIDHLAIGPGGVTVIDTKAARGRIQLTKVGGLLSPHRELLLVNGRDRTQQLDALERNPSRPTRARKRGSERDRRARSALLPQHRRTPSAAATARSQRGAEHRRPSRRRQARAPSRRTQPSRRAAHR